MAKKRTKKTALPSTDVVDELPEKFTKPALATTEEPASIEPPKVESDHPEPEPEPELKDDTMTTKLKTLDIPLASLRHGYEPRRCDVQAMTGRQPEMLKRLMNGLIAKGEKLENGRLVKREQDAIKWLLEQLAE